MKRRATSQSCAGFSILEGLVALALSGLVMAGGASLVAQWMPAWNRGFHAVQKADLTGLALDRIAADLGEARYVTGSAQDNYFFFSGEPEAVTFVRPVLDPGERPGLEVVRIMTVADKTGVRIVRRQARFTPLPPGAVAGQDLRFSSTAVLLRAQARIDFGYADAEGRWRSQWDDPFALPARVRIALRDPASGAEIAPSTIAVIHAEGPARCAGARSMKSCGKADQQEQGGQQLPAQQSGGEGAQQ
ncbi:MAG TPA: general secretion pathway protein GspJ [Rhodoblastus sp.]|nr:general secretion pathway protein GspJ [Rhodoblastus sp.]